MCIKIGRLLTFHLHIVIGAWEARESLVNSEAIFNWFSGNLTCVLCLYHATLLFSLAPHCRKPKPPNWDESLLTFDFYKSLFTSENWYPRGWVFFGEQGCVPWTWTCPASWWVLSAVQIWVPCSVSQTSHLSVIVDLTQGDGFNCCLMTALPGGNVFLAFFSPS